MKIKILIISMFFTQAYAVNVMPEIRTIVSVSKTDINRISCQNGIINSVDYAADTGLTHKTHANKKNIIILFKQLLNRGGRNEIINATVNILIGCNDEYYPLVLDPKKIDSQSIFLQTSKLEIEARKNSRKNMNKTYDQLLVDIVKSAREKIDNSVDEQPKIYLDGLQIKPSNQESIPGTNYQIIKFVIISTKNIDLTETQFLNTKLTKHPIVAISLDDFKLDNKKNWTYLYLVVENVGAR